MVKFLTILWYKIHMDNIINKDGEAVCPQCQGTGLQKGVDCPICVGVGTEGECYEDSE
jgi:DnaJ-class molecular chaperone